MEKSKLIELLRTFNTKELREFKEYLASPYFNKNVDLLNFFMYLKKSAPEFTGKKLEKEVIYKALYKGKSYDEKEISYLMSFTLKHAEQYIGLVQYKKYEIREQYHILRSCLERNLDKHYNYIFLKAIKNLNKQDVIDENHYYHQYLTSDIAYKHFLSLNIRKYDDRLQKAADTFDIYYLIHKLKYCCEMINRKKSIQANYKINMMEELVLFLEKMDIIKTPHLAIYYRILKTLLDEEDVSHFKELQQLLNEYAEKIPKRELKEMHVYLVNYCIRKVNAGEAVYLEELFEIYTSAIDKEILFENGFLSPWAFKNQIGVGLRLKKFDKVETFIGKYSSKLSPDFSVNAYNYNMAELHYYKKELDKALEYLNMVEFSDIYYSLDSKKMMMKIFYERKDVELLYSLIHSFKVFLKRNKLVSHSNSEIYSNFVGFVAQLLKSDKSHIEKLTATINAEPTVADKVWLLKKVEEL